MFIEEALQPVLQARALDHALAIGVQQFPAPAHPLIGLLHASGQPTEINARELHRIRTIMGAIARADLHSPLALQHHRLDPPLLQPLCRIKTIPTGFHHHNILSPQLPRPFFQRIAPPFPLLHNLRASCLLPFAFLSSSLFYLWQSSGGRRTHFIQACGVFTSMWVLYPDAHSQKRRSYPPSHSSSGSRRPPLACFPLHPQAL